MPRSTSDVMADAQAAADRYIFHLSQKQADWELFEGHTLFALKSAIRDAHDAVRAHTDAEGLMTLYRALIDLEAELMAVVTQAGQKVTELDR